MKPLFVLLLSCLLPAMAVAQEGFAPVPADEVALADLQYLKRPVVVFADSPNDPAFIRQVDLLTRDAAQLAERDVIVVIDTDPKAGTDWRKLLRPRGFSLVLMDKDGKVIIRKPLPWEVREITHAIDKTPLRRQEMQERRSGSGS
jgi:hypothetical protein